ncbi:MAG: hypothetical protein U0V70_21145 [Terriglobia bacterium]
MLKQRIIDHYWQEFKTAQQIKYWDNAKLALLSLLKVSPGNAEAQKELKNYEWKPKKKKEAPPAAVPDMNLAKLEGLHQQLNTALNSGNYVPPASGNAMDLIQQLLTLSPNDSMAKSGIETVQREVLNQVGKKVQLKEFESARNLLHQLQSHFPESSELSRAQAALHDEESRLTNANNDLTQKAEAALARGNYVTPMNESVLAYSQRLLAIDRQSPRALSLRRDALQKASDQVRDLVQKEKFDEAREILSVLYSVAQSDGKPSVAQDIKNLQSRIEFTTIPVVHDHTIGSCSGRLRMNAFVIAFVPSGDSKDGFSQRISEIADVEAGDKLKIQIKNKTYRFQVSASKNKDENRQKAKEISEQLLRAHAQASQESGLASVAHQAH